MIADSEAWDVLLGPPPIRPLRGSARRRHVQRLEHDAKAEVREILAGDGPPFARGTRELDWTADLTYYARAARAVDVLKVVVGMVERVESESTL